MQKFFSSICVLILFILSNGVNGERKLRIINSQYAKASDFKYIVTVLLDYGAVCGGAIIDNRFVVTAAHCVYDTNTKTFKANKFRIIAATNSWTDGNTAIWADVEKVYVPEIYAQRVHEADIAILKLEKSLEIENNPDKLQALSLPQIDLGQFENFGNYEVIFAGFGRADVKSRIENGMATYETSNKGWLRFAKARIIRLEECRMHWSPKYATDNHMCMRIIQDPSGQMHQGTCKADSGSPLVVNNVIVGIDSANQEACNDNVWPSIFTRVSSYLPFIQNVMNGFTSGMLVHPRA